jgi:hypothetical protein
MRRPGCYRRGVERSSVEHDRGLDHEHYCRNHDEHIERCGHDKHDRSEGGPTIACGRR